MACVALPRAKRATCSTVMVAFPPLMIRTLVGVAPGVDLAGPVSRRVKEPVVPYAFQVACRLVACVLLVTMAMLAVSCMLPCLMSFKSSLASRRTGCFVHSLVMRPLMLWPCVAG